MDSKNNANHGNDHKTVTPSTKGDQGKKDDKKFTSYDTGRPETDTPQEVRKEIEPEGLQERMKEAE